MSRERSGAEGVQSARGDFVDAATNAAGAAAKTPGVTVGPGVRSALRGLGFATCTVASRAAPIAASPFFASAAGGGTTKSDATKATLTSVVTRSSSVARTKEA